MKTFVTENYKDYSGDLFSVFTYRNLMFCKQDGYCGYMTPFVWMFIKTYEKLREFIIRNKSITTLVQMEYSAFEEATVPICSFVLKNGKATVNGLYFKLSDFKGGMEVQKQKVLEALADKSCGYFYETEQQNYVQIPGSPISYWVSDKVFEIFKSDSLGNHYDIKAGICTGANAKFIFYWHEINFRQTNICSPADYRYTAHNKGGEYRKWYGNRELILKYNSQALQQMECNDGFRHDGKEYYFLEHIGWSKITSGKSSFRLFEDGFTFDSAGLGLFPNSQQNIYVTLAFLNSCVSEELIALLNPTLNVTPMVVKKLPFCADNRCTNVGKIGIENVGIEKKDWDSYETSWDFKRNPLV